MPYKDFSALVLHQKRTRDFDIEIIDRSAQVTFAATHAGPIEPLTECIAKEAAGDRHNFYAFAATSEANAKELRVPVGYFNDLRLKNLMERSRTTVHIDGTPGEVPFIGLGTPDEDLEQAMTEILHEAGFTVGKLWKPADVYGGYRFFSNGTDANVQIELSETLRASLASDNDSASECPCVRQLNDRGRALAIALASGARTYLKRRDMDLSRTMAWFDETTEQVKKVVFKDGNTERYHQD